MSNQRYMQRGVSASKEDVHNAIKNIDKGIFPQAFCKIIPDILGQTSFAWNVCTDFQKRSRNLQKLLFCRRAKQRKNIEKSRLFVILHPLLSSCVYGRQVKTADFWEKSRSVHIVILNLLKFQYMTIIKDNSDNYCRG